MHTFIQAAMSAQMQFIFLVSCTHTFIPGLSDPRHSLIVAHGLLFGSFLPNRNPWASIWRKHCYDVLERNCRIKAHGPIFRKPWYWRYDAKWSIKTYFWQDNCIQVVKKHRTSNTLQILLSLFFLVHQA